jgi:hypothetical protein
VTPKLAAVIRAGTTYLHTDEASSHAAGLARVDFRARFAAPTTAITGAILELGFEESGAAFEILLEQGGRKFKAISEPGDKVAPPGRATVALPELRANEPVLVSFRCALPEKLQIDAKPASSTRSTSSTTASGACSSSRLRALRHRERARS